MFSLTFPAALLPSPPTGDIVVVGASGGTGKRALQGLLDAGCKPAQLRVLTRDPAKPSLQPLRALGMPLVQADLDDPATLPAALAGCAGCYVHSTAADTKQLDEGEEERARHLASALGDAACRHVVFNSAAAEPEHQVRRIAQKHAVEAVLSAALPSTHLRANLFMEELWKSYTRPAILKGSYPFSLPPERKLHLTSVRDMGRLAAAALASPDTTAGRRINVASDVLTPPQIAAAFAAAQGSPCVHRRNRLLYYASKVLLPDLYEVMKFYRTSPETTDVEALYREFPQLLTPFATFLDETRWTERTKTYEDLAEEALTVGS